MTAVSRLAVTAAVLISLASAVASTSTSTATAQDAGRAGGSAARTLDRCLASSDRLSVVVLMDQSGSLGGPGGTDPEAKRVDGLKAALSGLVRLAQTPVAGRRLPKADVLFIGFAGDAKVDESGDGEARWQPATPDNLDALLTRAEGFRTKDDSPDTNYRAALSSARDELARRSAEATRAGGAPPCKAIVWFTDGGYAIKGNPGKVAAGKRELCRPGGLMDGLQGDRVVTFTVALANTGFDPSEEGFLRAVTTGDGAACGTRLSRAGGEYLSAEDRDRLYFRFSDLLTPGDASAVEQQPVCPREPCARGRLLFKAVAGLSRFIIGFSSRTEGLELVLQGPDGAEMTLRKGGPAQQQLAGATIVQRWFSSRTVEVEGQFGPGGEWVGTWRYTPVNPASDRQGDSWSRVRLFTEIQPKPVDTPVVVRGGPTEIRISLVDGRGRPVGESPLADTATVRGVITDPTTGLTYPLESPVRDAAGVFTETVRLPADVAATKVSLDLEARFASLGSAKVAPSARSYPLDTKLPDADGYPSVKPAELRLPSIEGEGSTNGTLIARASDDSSGCVWVAPSTLTDPGGNPVRTTVEGGYTSAGSCLKLARGQERRLRVGFKFDGASEGTVHGVVAVGLHSDLKPAADRKADVPVSFEVAQPLDTVRAGVITALLVIGGALIPLLLLHLLNWWGARFTDRGRVRYLVRPLVIEPGMSARAPDGSTPTASYVDFEPLPGGGEDRAFDVEGLAFVTRASGSLRERTFTLVGGPYGAVATDPPAAVIITGAERPLRSWSGDRIGEVPLGLTSSWVFVRDRLDTGSAGGPGASSSLDVDDDEDELFLPQAEAAEPPAPRVIGRLFVFTGVADDFEAGQKTLDDALRQLASSAAEKKLLRPVPQPKPDPVRGEPRDRSKAGGPSHSERRIEELPDFEDEQDLD